MDPVNRLKAKIVLVSAAAVLFTGSVSADPLIDALGGINNLIYGIAAGIAALLIALQAIKYKTAAGPAEREEAKKGIINVIVGLAIIMVAGYMVGLIYYVEPVKTPSTIPKSTATTRIYVTTPTPPSTSTTTTSTSSTTSTTIETMNVVWVSMGYGPSESDKFMEIAKAAEADFLRKYPVKECPNPADRVKFYYITPDKCTATCDIETEICTGCITKARECVKNNGLGGIYDKFGAIMPSLGIGGGCAGGIPGDGMATAGYKVDRLATVATHELGHTYGLCHVQLCNAMCGATESECSWCPNYADIQDPHDWDIMTYCSIDEKFGPAAYEHLKKEFAKCITGC